MGLPFGYAVSAPDALVHLRAAWCVQSGPVVSVAQRPTFSDALVHLCGTACAVGLEGQSGSNAADTRVWHVMCSVALRPVTCDAREHRIVCAKCRVPLCAGLLYLSSRCCRQNPCGMTEDAGQFVAALGVLRPFLEPLEA